MNLHSTVNKLGTTTTQIFHFRDNVKRTFHGIISSEIKEGEMLKLTLKDGRMLIINKANLLMSEVFNEIDNTE